MDKFTFPPFEIPSRTFLLMNNMRSIFVILLVPLFIFQSVALGQRSKNKKNVPEQKGPRIFETIGDSLRSDSIVYYKTEIGFMQSDFGPKFKGKWTINVMR